jgi:hypothetical protein
MVNLMDNGAKVELQEYIERIFDEREKRWNIQFLAIEERLKRQFAWISLIIGFIAGIVGTITGYLLK